MDLGIGIKSDNELKDIALCLHDSIYNIECFGTKDLLLYDLACAELEKRGFKILVTNPTKLHINKK